jgi:TPR repeat protein
MSKSIWTFALASTLFLFVTHPAQADFKACKDAYAANNLKLAAKECADPAKQGHAEAQYNMGYMLSTGNGIKKNEKQGNEWYRKAVEWYRKAAEQGDADAQLYLGWMYVNGQGVTKDVVQAMAWYRKSADQGNADSQYNLGGMYANGRGVPKDNAQAVAWYRKAAEQGNANAQLNLGVMYGNGRGVPKDNAQAVAWYRKSAGQGNADAQYELGVMYENGLGVPKDDTEALAWYRKAAEQGDAYAQRNVGLMYENGRGAPKDDTEALAWYKKAAAGGNEIAEDYYQDLDKRLKCRRSATAIVFGVPLKCATRDDFRMTAKEAGAQATREEDNYWYDEYDSSAVLDKSKKLLVGYTNDDELAHVQYEFPSHMDTNLVVWVRDLVKSKYGWPEDSQGSPVLGEVTYTWKLKDGITVKVARGWPDTTTYLSYIVPEAKSAMEAEIAESKREAEEAKFSKQKNAF